MIVTWEPVTPSDRNGNITGYTVYYRAVSGNIVNNKEQLIKVNASVTRLEVSNLEEHANTSV